MSSFPFAVPLTIEDLLTRGYFHDRVVPAMSSLGLGPAVYDIQAHMAPILATAETNGFRLKLPRNRPVQHSVPKRKHLRRVLTIPNPLPYAILCYQIAKNWSEIDAFCSNSPISVSQPVRSNARAVSSLFQRNEEPLIRARRSVGARYLLRTDLVRFYPSIYTHSIPWAIHGKTVARNDTQNKLFGNRLDVCVREMQDRQTGGIPIGPDSSFIIGELVGSRLDLDLAQRMSPVPLRGTRFIDDYSLYFNSRGEAERAIAAIHGVAREFELEINDTKTELCELPEVFEPEWKTQLRGMQIDANDSGRSVHAFFDRAAELAPRFPFDSVYTYVAKKLLDASLSIETWAVSEPLLLRAVLAEPSMMTVLVELLDIHGVVDAGGIADTIESLCVYHAPLGQGYEVAWALWLACTTNTPLTSKLGPLLAQMDDDLVALIALDLRSRGLLDLTATPLWNSFMSHSHLDSEHWLLSYEALVQGWLPSSDGSDYVGVHPFFSILKSHNVRFYDPTGHGGVPSNIYGP